MRTASSFANSRSASVIILARALKVVLGSQLRTFLPGFGAVAQKQVDFGGAEISGVDLDVLVPIEVEAAEDFVKEFPDGVRLAGGDDVIVRLATPAWA